MPKKTKLPVCTEHQEAVALMQWCRVMTPKTPELDLLFAIPNGGARNVIVAKKLKAEGVKAGIPDYFLPVPVVFCSNDESYDGKMWADPIFNQNTHEFMHYVIRCPGLFLELKRSNGVPSDISKAQKEKMRLFEEQGYKCVVANGWEEAAKAIESYLTEEVVV